jgi:hypothetical protein
MQRDNDQDGLWKYLEGWEEKREIAGWNRS